jgi:hypothetical protein
MDITTVPLMTIVAHTNDNTISEKAEASFEESDPQRLKLPLLFGTKEHGLVSGA